MKPITAQNFEEEYFTLEENGAKCEFMSEEEFKKFW